MHEPVYFDERVDGVDLNIGIVLAKQLTELATLLMKIDPKEDF